MGFLPLKYNSMNFILASTSTLPGGEYLQYLQHELEVLYQNIDEILFIPFARPSGISHEEYTQKAKDFFQKINKNLRGLHEFEDYKQAIEQAQGYFTGGGNTFLLVKTLHENHLMKLLAEQVQKGKPYLGCSAGSNIGGLNMKTTNDMPIVYPPSFDCMGLIPYNINPHYLDPIEGLNHNGETRETRIIEFLSQNPEATVIGLREGNWVRRKGNTLRIEGTALTRIFEHGKTPYEVETGHLLSF